MTLWLFGYFQMSYMYGLRHAKMCLRAYADSESLDQPVHQCSPLLSACRTVGYYGLYQWKIKAQMRLCVCAG